MLEDMISDITGILRTAGFVVLTVGSTPKSETLKGEDIAFVELREIKCRQTGFDFVSNDRKRLYEYTVSCRLLGKQGDCSDRDRLLSKAEYAKEGLLHYGYDATLKNDMKLNAALSRAECQLTAEKSEIYTP